MHFFCFVINPEACTRDDNDCGADHSTIPGEALAILNLNSPAFPSPSNSALASIRNRQTPESKSHRNKEGRRDQRHPASALNAVIVFAFDVT